MNIACVSILGHFGDGKTLLNGQTIKTKILAEELCAQLGWEQVVRIDTHGGVRTLFKAPFQGIRALMHSRNVIILPAQNGVRVYAPLLALLRKFFRKRKLHYVVIGGWLPEFLKRKKCLSAALKKFDNIYVETRVMKRSLEEQGFSNVIVMPNCKKLRILTEDELIFPDKVPYRICTFSRVMKEKGIEDAVNAVTKINTEFGDTVYTLDIYGQAEPSQTEWFDALQTSFPEYVRYRGCVSYEETTEILKEYFALLFPTHFYTEGIPGTIIDAYAAGIPVISARWESYTDVVEEGRSGIGYEFDDSMQLETVLKRICEESAVITVMKSFCLRKASEYRTDKVIRILLEQLEH